MGTRGHTSHVVTNMAACLPPSYPHMTNAQTEGSVPAGKMVWYVVAVDGNEDSGAGRDDTEGVRSWATCAQERGFTFTFTPSSSSSSSRGRHFT